MTADQILKDALKAKESMDKEMMEWYEPVMPDSWVEDGVRHAVIYGGDLMPEKLEMRKFGNVWITVDEVTF